MTESETIVIDPASDLFVKDPVAWFKGYRNYIFTSILPKVLPNNNKFRNTYASIMISDEAMNIFVVAVTDPSVDRNPGKNYQMLETLGDRQLESIFSSYVVSIYPKMTESLLTELKSTYMSKIKQGEMANKLGLNKWIRTNFDNTIHTSEDLFESLFGALFKVGETYIGKGNGYAFCTNLMTNLYYDLEIDPDTILLRPITQFKQIVEKLDWGQARPEKFVSDEFGIVEYIENENDDSKWRLILKLTKNGINFISTQLDKPIINGGLLASQVNKNKSGLINTAYAEALENLKSLYGINHDWAVNRSEKETTELIESVAKNRMDQDRLISAYFPKITKSEKSQFLQFVGIDASGNHIILSSIVGDFKEGLLNLKKFAIGLYAKMGKSDPSQPIIYDPNF